MLANDLMVGRWTRLRVVDPRDYDMLRAFESSFPALVHYRQRGVTLSPEQFIQSLWSGVVAQFVICRRDSGEPCGVVALYGSDLRNRYCRVAGAVFPSVRGAGWALEGIALGIDYAFRVFDIRKLYADVHEFNSASMAFLTRPPFIQEAAFRQHEFHDGKYWDHFVYALYADAWAELRAARLFQSGLASAIETHAGLDS